MSRPRLLPPGTVQNGIFIVSELLIRKLESLGTVGSAERRAILSLPEKTRSIGPRVDVDTAFNDNEGAGIHWIESGFACRYKFLTDGRRQILCFLLPGDVLNLRHFISGRPQRPVASISALQLKAVSSKKLLAILERYPSLARVLWLSTLTEESIGQEWLVSMGLRTAIERMAHLLCELRVRLDAVGLVSDGGFDLPLTQGELAEALGLSAVHVNRTLQQLRREGHVAVQNGRVTILDFESMKQQALFSPAYLNLKQTVQAQAVVHT